MKKFTKVTLIISGLLNGMTIGSFLGDNDIWKWSIPLSILFLSLSFIAKYR